VSVVYLILPLALVVAAVAVGAFVWAVRRGQFDDMQTPAVRVLFDDDEAEDDGDADADERPGHSPGM